MIGRPVRIAVLGATAAVIWPDMKRPPSRRTRLDKTEGSGAGWLRGIRQRAQVTPLALLARSHLTCP